MTQNYSLWPPKESSMCPQLTSVVMNFALYKCWHNNNNNIYANKQKEIDHFGLPYTVSECFFTTKSINWKILWCVQSYWSILSGNSSGGDPACAYSWRHLASPNHSQAEWIFQKNCLFKYLLQAWLSCVCMLWFKRDQFSRKENSVTIDQVQKAMQISSSNCVKREIASVFWINS